MARSTEKTELRGPVRRERGKPLGRVVALCVFAALACSEVFTAQAGDSRAIRMVAASSQYGSLPLSFEKNVGQTDAQVKFLARGAGYSLFLTSDETVLRLNGARTKVTAQRAAAANEATRHPGEAEVLRVRLLGANRKAVVAGAGELPGKSNYLIGNDPRRWHVRVPNYSKVAYTGVYRGVDMVFYGRAGRLEYDYRLAPGAEWRQAKFQVTGARAIGFDSSGDLVLKTAGGEITLRRPLAYQQDGQARRPVEAGYRRLGKREFGFKVGRYRRELPLTIDPVLAYSTYLGGSGGDIGYGIAVNSAGEAYVAGSTGSTNFPVKGAEQASAGGGGDAFVAKLDAKGSGLVYSTYLGGSGADTASGIAIDAAGDAYLAGTTSSSNFPVTAKAPQTIFGGVSDAFVAELSPDGSTLIYGTYLGGNAADFGQGIAIDSTGNAYVTGSTQSPDFPVVNALQPGNDSCSIVNNALVCSADAFVAKVNSSGTALDYCTYLGGSGLDSGQAIATDAVGDAYIAGYTASSNFPTQAALQSASAGGVDAFITELDRGGTSLIFSTYLGGNDQDQAFGLALDAGGDIYVAGGTSSGNFPTTANVFQSNYGGNEDAFVTKLGPGGSSLLYSTLIGGSAMDQATAVAVDAQERAVAVGATQSTDFPTVDALQRILGISGSGTCGSGACSDAFVTLLDATGGAVYSTYLGGTGADVAQAVALDPTGVPYVTGSTQSTNFPAVAGALQGAYAGTGTSGNVFVAKVQTNDAAAVALSPQIVNFGNQALNVASTAQTVTLINAGSADLQISGVTATGDFSATNNCGTTVPAGGATCTISITYRPTTAGPNTAQVSIDDNAGGSPQVITVTGNGVTSGGGTLTLTPQSILFPVQAVGTTSPAQQIQVVNGGQSSVTITDISTTGDFAQTNNCGAVPTIVNPNSSCTITVTFTPTVSGTRSGTVAVTDNAAGSPQSVTLSGTSSGPFTLSSDAHSSTIVIGEKSTEFTISASAASSFTSSIALSCMSGTCTFNPTSIMPGQSSTLTVSGLSATSTNPTDVTVNGKSGSYTASLSLSVFLQDFLVSATPGLRSVNAGQSATYTVSISPINGFNGVVLLACRSSLLPQGVSCSWSPSSGVTLNGTTPTTATVTVTTTSQQSSGGWPWRGKPKPPGGWWPGVAIGLTAMGLGALLAVLAAGFATLGGRRSKAIRVRTRLALLAAAIVVLAAGAVGCQTYGYNVIGAPTIIGTPTGSYVITISGTLGSDGTVIRTSTVNLSVSPG
jgi:Beta-propeller repeat/HYDIN/CFA65/VesB-like, Ig-like domain/Abnormal spindle-like microcephaly-assoc'd, ASPM-SPD-2-Hydin